MIDHAAYLGRILADPDADAPRLAYADALSAAGDPRGELIRLQCELAPTFRGVAIPGADAKSARESELLRAHADEWTADVRALGATPELFRGFVALARM